MLTGVVIVAVFLGTIASLELSPANSTSVTTNFVTVTSISTVIQTLDSTSQGITSSSSAFNSTSGLWFASALESGNAICVSLNELPDPKCTPGTTNSNVTQGNIYSTICISGWTSTVRPPESYTEPLKYASITDYRYNDTDVGHYEEDHLIPLELGGSPTSVYNLWAQPLYGKYTAYEKDALEDFLNGQVCDGKMALDIAQQDIASNWIQYWEMYTPNQTISGTD